MVVCGHRGVFPIVGRERARPPRLSKRHGRPQRRHPPQTRGGMPADRDRWVRVRRWGDCAPLWVGVRLWSSAQDSAERSRRPSRTAPEDRHGGSAEGCAVGVGGFRDPAHLVRRASQPHDSPRLGVLAPSLALPRPWRRPAPRARRPLALLLQFHPAAQGVEVRSRDPDASDASRLGERANELERHLHGAGRSLRIPCGGRTRSRCRPAGASVIKCW